jgi:steroid delta-isomerase-like uncharacterized protein
MSTAPPEAVVAAYFRAVGTAELADFLALFSEDVHFEDPVGSPVLTGHDGAARFHKTVGRAWQRLSMAPGAVYARGPHVAAQWSAEGHSASGKDIRFDGINVFTLDDQGRIARLEGYWDWEGVVAQMVEVDRRE